MRKMKHLRSLFSFLISLLMILSVVVFPAAERFRNGAEGTAEAPLASMQPEHTRSAVPVSPAIVQAAPDAPGEADGDGRPAPASVPEIAKTASAEEEVTPFQEAEPAAAPGEAIRPAETTDPPIAKETADNASPHDEAAVSTAARATQTVTDAVAEKTAAPAAFRRGELAYPTIDTLYPLTFDQEYSGTLTSVDERHIYHFEISERGYLQYTVKHAEMRSFMGWDVTLYQEYYLNGVDGQTGFRAMNLLQTTALATTEASPTVGVMPGRYRVVVKTTGGVQAEEYRLTVGFTADHTHEIECNDTKAAYTELYPNLPMVGSASCYSDRQDEDWFLLRIQQDGSLSLSFQHTTADSVSVAWRVALYNEAGEELYAENSGMNKETVESGELGVSAGIYFVAVICRVRCEEDYTLTVNASSGSHFERENNDSMETATPLANGSSVKGCVSTKAGRLDRDFYRFEIPSRGNFSMTFAHDTPPIEEGKEPDDKNGWNIRLLSASGEVMYSMTSSWYTPSVSMPVMGLEAGSYFIEINSEDLYRSILTYTLTAGNTQASSFETEPNNTPEQATPIANGVPVTGSIIDAASPDDDFYVFHVPSYSRVTVLLKHEPQEDERDIFRFSVCDENGEKAPVYFGSKPMTGSDGKNIYFVDSLAKQPTVSGLFELPAGTYYITVTSGRFFRNIDYMIQFYFS